MMSLRDQLSHNRTGCSLREAAPSFPPPPPQKIRRNVYANLTLIVFRDVNRLQENR